MFKLKYMIGAMLLFSLALFSACENKTDVRDTMIEKEKADAIEKLSNASSLLENEIVELEVRLSDAGDENEAAAREQMQKLSSLNINVEKHMNKISEVPAEEWEEYKAEMRNLLNDVKNELAKHESEANPQN